MPRTMENIEETPEWESGGKWLLFNNDNLKNMDEMWLQLQRLVADGILLRLKFSKDSELGNDIIMCYTPDWKDKRAVKRAADGIRNAVTHNHDIYYKTNEATKLNIYRIYGYTSCTTYKHTIECSMYERDENRRWTKISFEADDPNLN